MMELPLHYKLVDVPAGSATVYDAKGSVVASRVSEEVARRIMAHDELVEALEDCQRQAARLTPANAVVYVRGRTKGALSLVYEELVSGQKGTRLK